MRGSDQRHDGLFSYVRPESRIPKGHPLRVIRTLADAALTALNDQFAALYSKMAAPRSRPSSCCVLCYRRDQLEFVSTLGF